MNGGLSVLGDVYKTDIFRMANWINRDREIIPVNTILKPPSAELRPDQKDSDSLPDYDILDQILFNYIELNHSPEEIVARGFDELTVLRTVRMVNMNEYKRFQAPPYPEDQFESIWIRSPYALGGLLPLTFGIEPDVNGISHLHGMET